MSTSKYVLRARAIHDTLASWARPDFQADKGVVKIAAFVFAMPRIVRSPRTRMLLQTESICLGRSCDKFERRALQPSGPLKALSL